MEFLHIDNKEEGAKILAKKIGEYLKQDKKVLWLLSGGSNISISVKVLNILKSNDKDGLLKNNLAVTLTDERFGPVGHSDSNWQQLILEGFEMRRMRNVPVLKNLTLEETRKKFAENYQELVTWADVIIGQFGIGSDGHTAGILPNTIGVNSTEITCGYEAGKFQRISLTLNTIKSISIAYVFIFGEEKRRVVQFLKNQNLALADMPAQILKLIREAYLYTDFN
jgi:6-phosphogluconolactonase/glucosamine-6-phosphate isomerase/deaminase